jgi:hypothetical protein
MKKQNEATLREFLALFCADIDIFLLQDESQQNDLDKLYSKDEIREQLHKTMEKFTSVFPFHPMVFDVPLFTSLTRVALLESGFSKSELDSIEEQIKLEKSK